MIGGFGPQPETRRYYGGSFPTIPAEAQEDHGIVAFLDSPTDICWHASEE